jgi:hypothetical protein
MVYKSPNVSITMPKAPDFTYLICKSVFIVIFYSISISKPDSNKTKVKSVPRPKSRTLLATNYKPDCL